MRKKIFMILFCFIGLFIVMLFTNNSKVYAAEGPEYVYIRTEIQRWSDNNDLIYKKVDNWNGSWYTKRVYLTTENGGDPTGNGATYREIETSDFNSNNEFSLNGISDFTNGDTIYLVEEYHITSTSSFNSVATLAGQGNAGIQVPTSDYLTFPDDIPSDIQNATFEYYYDYDHYIYAIKLYDSTDASTTDRSTTVYYAFESSLSSGDKNDSADRGYILLPVYGVAANFEASGNIMPAGHFHIYTNTGEEVSDIEGNEAEPTNNYGSMYGYIIMQDDYSLYSYYDIANQNLGLKNNDAVMYEWENEAATSDGSRSISYEIGNELESMSGVDNGYYITITGEIEENQDAPNGVFHNIIPFIIAGIFAIAGIVFLKKKSIK